MYSSVWDGTLQKNDFFQGCKRIKTVLLSAILRKEKNWKENAGGKKAAMVALTQD